MEILKLIYLLLFAATVLGGLWEDLKKDRSWLSLIPLCIADVAVFGFALGPPLVALVPMYLALGLIGFGVALNVVSFVRDFAEIRIEHREEGGKEWTISCTGFLALAIVIPAFVMATMNVIRFGTEKV